MTGNKEVWTEKEVNFLKENINKMTYAELARKLKKTPNSVAGKAYRDEIKKKKTSKRWKARKWNKKEEDFLIENANKMTTEELADKLNRSYHSIIGKRNLLVKYGVVEKITKCPRCNSFKQIGDVGNNTYFCRNCLIEFKGNGKILEPLYK